MSGLVDDSSDMLLRRLRDMVEAGAGEVIQNGRVLPERRLMEVFGVGRRTVRQALDVLEAEGLLVRRQGQGTFVKTEGPPFAGLASLSSWTSPVEIMEARREIEPTLARLAAMRATPADIEQLTRFMERGAVCETGGQYERWDSAFHTKIAESVKNSLFLGIFELIGAVRAAQNWSTVRDKTFSPALRDELVGHHRRIVAAIRDRDPEEAEAAMRFHLDFVTRTLGN